MILRLIAPGVAVAVLLAAAVPAAQAGADKAPEKAAAAEDSGRKVVKLRVVRKDGKTDAKETELVIDGEEIGREIELAVDEAMAEAAKALEQLDAEIQVEVNGEKLEALSESHRETLEKVRERLKDMGKRLGEKTAQIEVRVARTAEKAAKAAEEAGEALREQRVIILRDRAGDAKIEIDSDEDGRTVVIIRGDDVKVVTGGKAEKAEKAGKAKTPK